MERHLNIHAIVSEIAAAVATQEAIVSAMGLQNSYGMSPEVRLQQSANYMKAHDVLLSLREDYRRAFDAWRRDRLGG